MDSETTRPGSLPAQSAEENSAINVKIRPLNVKLGEPISLVIEGEKIGQSTALLDWTALQQNFVIDDVDQHAYLLRLTLFPLKVGELEIPEQKAGRVHIPKTVIKVEPNPEVTIQWQKPQTELFSTQQGIWQAQVEVTNPAFLVEIQPPPNLESQSIIGRILHSDNHLKKHMVSLEMPSVLQRNTLQIKSPVIVVKNSSNRRWKFFDAPQTLQVKPLPSFLPMSVVVGELDWHIAPLNTFYQVGDLHYWHWQVSGQGVSEESLKATAYQLVGQLPHNEQLSWLAESMQVKHMINELGEVTQLDIQVPFRVKQPGLVDFPELILRSFNPNKARVEQTVFSAVKALAVPGWLLWILNSFILIVGVGLGYFLLLILKQYWLILVLRKQINQAQNCEEIVQAILHWQSKQIINKHTNIESSNQITSLNQFEKWFKKSYGEASELKTLIADLNVFLYSKEKPNHLFEDIQNRAKSWLNSISVLQGVKRVFVSGLLSIRAIFSA